MTTIPCIIRPDSFTVILKGETLVKYSVDQDFNECLSLLLEDKPDELYTKMKPIVRIQQDIGSGDRSGFHYDETNVYYNGQAIQQAIAKRMLWMIDNGISVVSLEAFYKNLQQNPSFRAVNELFGFLDKNDLPITQDGYFLAYKKVRENFFDIHSNTMDNSPGNTLTMPRNMVNEDSNQTCSQGLHVCSQNYLDKFGSDSREADKIVCVKINPKDVVSVPVDYNNAKMRVCEYTVLHEVDKGSIPKNFVKHLDDPVDSEEEDHDGFDEESEDEFVGEPEDDLFARNY